MSPRERRVRGEGSVHQRADGYWVAQVNLGKVGGKRIRKTVTAKTRKELTPKLARLKREVEQGVLSDATTVEQWLDYWLTEVAPKRVRPRTLAGYAGYVNTWLVPQLGHHRLDKLQPAHVRALHKAMEDAGLADATRRQAHAILRRALVVAERDGKVSRNVAALVDPPPVGKVHRQPLTLVECQKVIAHIDGHPDAARWLCALLEGLRQGEALGLRWEDVDLANHRMWIVQTIQRQKGRGLVVVPPKSRNSTRPIPLLPSVHLALTLHREATGGTGYVWGGAKPIDPRRDWQAWKDMLAAAGVGDHPLHAARSTTASLLMAAGVPVKVISEILGHAHIAVTDVYMHGDELQHQKAMAALEAYIRPEE